MSKGKNESWLEEHPSVIEIKAAKRRERERNRYATDQAYRERKIAATARHRKANRDRVLESLKQYRDKPENRERARQKSAEWRRQNPVKYALLKRVETYRRRLLKRECLEIMGTECLWCKETDWRVLEFHHIDLGDKESVLSRMISNNSSIGKILPELEKCVVLCANCHVRYHYEYGGLGRPPSLSAQAED